MAVNWIRRKKALRGYARKHDIDLPKGFKVAVNGCGDPCKKLIRGVKKHAGLKANNAVWTQGLNDLLFPPSFGRLVVRLAKAEVGTKEHPANSNDGPRVRVYQSSTGAYKAAWCGSGACWLEKEAAKQLGITLKWFSNPAYVPNWTAAIKAGKLFKQVSFTNAKGGDVVCLWNSGHIETVVKRDGDYLVCVGFNTTPSGKNANGGMVAITRRHKSEVTIIGRRRGV